MEVQERTNNENNGTPARQFEKESRDFVVADVKFRWTEFSFRISRITSQDFFLPLWFRKIREPVTEGVGGGKGRLAEERRERGTGGDTYFPRARLARGNFATRVFPKIYVCPCHRLTTSLACYGYYRALAFVRDASESYHPITVWPFRHLRDAIRKFLRRMFFPAESAASGISFQRRISLIFAR